jgi:hypothetical protein
MREVTRDYGKRKASEKSPGSQVALQAAVLAMFEKRLQVLEQKRDKLAQDPEEVRAEIKLRDVFSRSVRNQNAADRKSSASVGMLVIQREREQDGSASIDGNHRPAIAIGDAVRVSSAIFHNSFDCQSACALPV